MSLVHRLVFNPGGLHSCSANIDRFSALFSLLDVINLQFKVYFAPIGLKCLKTGKPGGCIKVILIWDGCMATPPPRVRC